VIAFAILILAGSGAFLLRSNEPQDVQAVPATEAKAGSPALPLSVPGNASDQSAALRRLSVEEFRALGAEVMKALPTRADLQKSSDEDLHYIPPPLIKAGAELGKIAEAIANEPSLESEGVTLYHECAASPQHPDSIRALCFSNYRRLTKKTGKPFDQYVVRKNLRDLADKLDF
jgi:hypothetical protein